MTDARTMGKRRTLTATVVALAAFAILSVATNANEIVGLETLLLLAALVAFVAAVGFGTRAAWLYWRDWYRS